MLGVGGSTGTLRGNIIINSGATVAASAGDALGYNGAGTGPAIVTINAGGTFYDIANANEGYTSSFNLAGGTISSTGGYINFNAGYGINQIAGNTTSVVSAPVYARGAAVFFNTSKGTTASGVDLSLTGNFSYYGAGYGTIIQGTGYTQFSGTDGNTGSFQLSGGSVNLGTGVTFSASAPLVLSGVALTSSATANLTFASTNVSNQGLGGGTTFVDNATNTVALKTFTRTIGSTLDVSGATATFTTTSGNTNGIIGGWLTVGGGANFGSNQSGSIVGLPNTDASYITSTTAGSTYSNYALMNVDVNSNQSIGLAIAANSLRFNAATNYTLTLGTGANSLASGGILVTPSVGANTATIAGGTGITLWGPATGDLIINNYDTTPGGGLTISAVLANSSTGAALTVSGPGTTTLTAANTYGGPTYVNAGSLIVNARSGGNIYYVAPNATLYMGYGIGASYGSGIVVNGNGTSATTGLYLEGGNSYCFESTLTLQTAPTTIRNYSTGTPVLQGYDTNYYHLSVAASASGSVIVPGINYTTSSYGYRMTVAAGVNNATGDLTIGGVMSGSGHLNENGLQVSYDKWGTGSLLLTGNSNYTTGFWVNAGALILGNTTNTLPAGTSVLLGDGGTNGGTLVLGTSSGPTSQSLANINAWGSGTDAVVGGSASPSALNINYTTTSVAELYSGYLGGAGTYQNNFSYNKSGAGLVQLSGTNTYTQGTYVTGGTLSFISASSIPGYNTSIASAASMINVSTGATVAFGGLNTNTLSAAIPTFVANGNFSSGSFFAIDTTNGATIYSGILPLPAGVGFTTVTTSTVYLSGSNTFTGGVAVKTGTLEALQTTALPGYASPGNISVASGGTLALAVGGTGKFASSDITSVVGNVAFASGSFLGIDTANAANVGAGFTYAGVISGAEGLTKLGVNTLTLTGSNTFTGGVNINGGTLSLGTTGSLSTTAGLVLNSGTLSVGASNPLSPSFATTSAASGANVILNNGSSNIGAGTLSHVAGASIDFTGPITTSTTNNAYGIIGGWATQGGGATWATNSTNAAGGAISPYTGYVTTATAGTTASNYNASNIDVTTSVTQTALITPATLRFNTNAATVLGLTSANISSGGILVTPSVGAFASNISGGTIVGAPSSDLVIHQYNTAGVLNISSAIANNTAATALTKTGPGTVSLTGINTYTGGTFVNGGTLIEAATGVFNVGVINGNVTVNNGGTLSFTGTNLTKVSDTVTINGGGTFNLSNATQVLSGANTNYLGGINFNSYNGVAAVANSPDASAFRYGYNGNGLITSAGPVMNIDNQGEQLTNGGGYTLTVTASAGNTLLMSGAFTEYTGLTGMPVNFNGAGTVILSGTNSYVGTTTVTNGTLQLGNGGATGNIGSGPIVDKGALVFNTTTPTTTLANTITGTGSLTQAGTGNLVLSGASSYSGFTNVSSGKLYVTGTFTGTGPFAVGSGATLGGTATIAGTATVASGGSIEAGMTGTGQLTLGGLTLNGTDAINFGSLSNYASTTGLKVTGSNLLDPTGGANSVTINVASVAGAGSGTYKLIGYSGSIGGSGFSAFTLAGLPSRTSGTLVNNPGEIDLTIGGSGSDYLVWTGAGNLANGWDTATANWKLHSTGAATTYINTPSPDAVVFDDTASSSNTSVVINNTVNPSGLTFNNNANNYTFSGTAGISGSVTLNMTGSGNVTFNNSNSFTGGIQMTGSGMLSLNNANTITGPITVGSGILNVQNSGALGTSSSMNVASGATVQLQGNITTGSTPVTLNGTGSGSLGGALVNLTGTNTYGGAVTLAGPTTISVNSGSLTLASGISGAYGLTLTGPAGTTGTVSGAITTGAGTITMNGLGTWTLNGADSLTGLTTVNSGTLIVNGDAGQAHSYTVAQNATLDLGYSSGGGYSGGIVLNGSGLSSTAGLYLKNGITFYTNADLIIQSAPTTINTYNSTGGVATIRGFDVNSGAFLNVASAASGSVIASTINLNTGSYGFTLSTTSGANNSTGDLTVMGSITGGGAATGGFSGGLYNGAFNKEGSGSVLLTGTSTYSNGTDIQNGSVILAGGTNTLPGTTYVQLGYNGFVGQLLLSGVNQTITGLYNSSGGSGSSVVGNSATTSILTVNFSSFNNSGTVYTTDTFGGGIGGGNANQNNLILSKTGTGTFVVANNGNSYSGGTNVIQGTLTGTTNNVFGTGHMLINPTGITGTSADAATVNTNNSIATNAVVTVNTNSATAIGTLNFNGNNETIGSLSGNGNVVLNNPSGTALTTGGLGGNTTFSGNIGDGGLGTGSLIVSGTGTFTLSGSNSYGSGTTVSAGTLALASANAYPVNTALTVSTGATLVVNHSTGSIYVPQISSLNNSGTIDITNNGLLIHNGNSGVVATIDAELATAYGGGTWAGNTSTGASITSSTAQSDLTHLTAVGMEVGTGLTTPSAGPGIASFESSGIAATDVVVKYTYYGDVNLNGSVDGGDYSVIDSTYATEGFNNGVATNAISGWYNGDFNYDGVVDGSDYTLMDNAFNSQTTQFTTQLAAPTALIGGASAGGSAVPEPATLSLLGIGAIGLLGRRRRQR